MTMIVLLTVAVLLGVGVLTLINRKAISRMFEAGSAQLGQAGLAVWNADLQAIWNKRIDDATTHLQEATGGLREYQTLMSDMQGTVAQEEAEEKSLVCRVKHYLTENNEDEAGKAALKLKSLQTRLGAHKGKLADYQQGYQNNLKKVRSAREEIVEYRQKGQQYAAENRMAKAEAALTEAACKVNVNGTALDGLAELESAYQHQINSNRAARQVARDIGTDGLDVIEERERIQAADAKAVLAEMKAQMGLDQPAN